MPKPTVKKVRQIDENTYRLTVLANIRMGNFWDAARLLWPHLANIKEARQIFEVLGKNDLTCIGGHASAMKTYLTCARYLLDYYIDPENTAVIITGPTLVSMRSRAWSDIKWLHLNTRVKMPGILRDHIYRIITKKDTDKPGIHGIAGEAEDAQTKIQGLHLGAKGKTRLIMDEADNPYNMAIWRAIYNMAASGDFKAIALANPFDRTSEFARISEPECGWANADPDGPREWMSRQKWYSYFIDGLQSHNIRTGKDEFPFLLTNKGLNFIKEQKGENSAEWWAYVRGWFPPAGLIQSVFPADLVDRMSKFTVKFYGETAMCATLDPSFGGGDNCVLTISEAGRLAADPKKVCFQVREQIYIKRTEDIVKETGELKTITQDFGDQAIAICKQRGVDPFFFALDDTGPQGLGDYIAGAWSSKILRVEFGGACTEIPILDEDSRMPVDRYDRFVTELWFGAREWAAAGLIGVDKMSRRLRIQLESRVFEIHGRKSRMEEKKIMKKRGLDSPDEADSFCITTFLMRMRFKKHLPTLIPESKKARRKFKGPRMSRTIYQQTYGVKPLQK